MEKLNEIAALTAVIVLAFIGCVAAVTGNMFAIGWFVLAGIALVIWPALPLEDSSV